MRRLSRLLAVLPLLAAAALLSVNADATQAMPFFDFYGYSYQVGPPDAVGTLVNVPTRLNTNQPEPIWPLDFADYEYTISVQDMVIAAVSESGPMQYFTLVGGTIGLYRDASMNSSWVTNPPNAAVPTTFNDGEAQLTGHFTDVILIFNSATGTGTVSGTFDWTGGTLLGSVVHPIGWTYFGGVSNNAGLEIPTGYNMAWDPQIYGPPDAVPVEQSSWGRIKATFR
jgi:hypothetical protein